MSTLTNETKPGKLLLPESLLENNIKQMSTTFQSVMKKSDISPTASVTMKKTKIVRFKEETDDIGEGGGEESNKDLTNEEVRASP